MDEKYRRFWAMQSADLAFVYRVSVSALSASAGN